MLSSYVCPVSLTKKQKIAIAVVCAFALVLLLTSPVFADTTTSTYTDKIKTILTPIINIVCTLFQVVGVMLAIFGIVQLVLAIKNEDSNSKTNAVTLMGVGIMLLVIPALIKSLDLVSMIGT